MGMLRIHWKPEASELIWAGSGVMRKCFMKIYLQTERMILREFTLEDVDNLVDLDSDPAVTRYINGGKPSPKEWVVEKVMPRILGYYENLDRQGIWAAIDKHEGGFMGWFHLRPNHAARAETELGYRLKRRYWGQGFATEGSLALIEKGFEELQAEIIVAIADPDNGASRRVMEKAGLTFVQEYSEEDGFVVVKYALTRESYFGGRKQF